MFRIPQEVQFSLVAACQQGSILLTGTFVSVLMPVMHPFAKLTQTYGNGTTVSDERTSEHPGGRHR
jgi:hypothetical protein